MDLYRTFIALFSIVISTIICWKTFCTLSWGLRKSLWHCARCPPCRKLEAPKFPLFLSDCMFVYLAYYHVVTTLERPIAAQPLQLVCLLHLIGLSIPRIRVASVNKISLFVVCLSVFHILLCSLRLAKYRLISN